MAKAMAIVRSLFVVFIVGFTVRALPIFWQTPRTFDEQYARCASNLDIAQRAAWYAIAWIAFETAVGWYLALQRQKPAAQAPTAPAQPPTAPPPSA